MNAFQLAQAAHDYDLDTEYQASIETRLSTYATQQYNLTLYNVTLFGGSTGVRVAIPQLGLPGATVKPYLLGTSSLLGNQSYLNAGEGDYLQPADQSRYLSGPRHGNSLALCKSG